MTWWSWEGKALSSLAPPSSSGGNSVAVLLAALAGVRRNSVRTAEMRSKVRVRHETADLNACRDFLRAAGGIEAKQRLVAVSGFA